ncbi:MAG: LPS assembly protein LptD [Thermodesulfovibrionales bacterium]
MLKNNIFQIRQIKWPSVSRLIAGAFILFTIHYSLFTGLSGLCFAEENTTVITSDGLEYNAAAKQYRMTGSVTATRNDAVIKADELLYSEGTSEITATGNVRYEDHETSLTAGRADMNLDAKTGKLYDATFLHKKNNYHLSGKVIEKKGEDYYYSPEATFTTCDTPVPDWCFRGKEVNAVMGDTIRGREISFRIKDLPVLYSPYLFASLNAERHTGLLMPTPGYSKTRGASLNLPFYWAIAENRDATFIVDTFSRRGIGTGLEYRFVDPGGVKSSWWAYHIRDTGLDRDFFEIRALHEDRDRGKVTGFLNLNYVNQKDFYQEFHSHREIRIQRFLESTAETSLSMPNARLYLLSQYLVDLQPKTGAESASAPQKLPEAGYVINYTRVGDTMISAAATAADLYRQDGVSAGRLDIYPRMTHRLGNDITLLQTVGLRGTGYAFYKEQDNNNEKDSLRGAFEYDVSSHASLFRNFSFLTHVIEPSLRYHFIYSPKSSHALPVYDATELFGKTSHIEFSILNRGIIQGSEAVSVRITQGIDTYGGSRPFLPFRVEAGVKTPVTLLVDTTYDYYTHKIETARSDLSIKISKVNMSLGQRFNRTEEINVYTTGADFSPLKNIQITSSLWYDAKGAGLRDVNFSLKYSRQCWSMKLEAIKRPGDFSARVMFELAGVGSRMATKQ